MLTSASIAPLRVCSKLLSLIFKDKRKWVRKEQQSSTNDPSVLFVALIVFPNFWSLSSGRLSVTSYSSFLRMGKPSRWKIVARWMAQISRWKIVAQIPLLGRPPRSNQISILFPGKDGRLSFRNYLGKTVDMQFMTSNT